MLQNNRQSLGFLGLCFLASACLSSTPVLPLAGEPPEVEKLLKEQGQELDQRPGSVRTVDRFFQALEEGDGHLCWYLLDLRAAAAWQIAQSKSSGEDAGPSNIVSLLRGNLEHTDRPESVKRIKLSPNRTAATIAVVWGESSPMNIVVAMNQDGWRLVLAPEGAALPDLSPNPQSSQRAAPVDFDEIHRPETGRRQQGGGLGGGMGRF